MDEGQEPAGRAPRGQDGNTLVWVMIFAGLMAALVPIFTQMIKDSSINSGESKVVMSRKILMSNLLGLANSPAALLQSSYQASWSTSPTASPTPLYNNCLWTCLNGPGSSFVTATTDSSCETQMSAQGITAVGGTARRCQSYNQGSSYDPIWYDFTLTLPNESTVMAGRISDSTSAAYQRFTLDGVPCTSSQPDSRCPFVAKAQFHPVCPGDPLVSSTPTPRPTTPAYPSADFPAPIACAQAATIQSRIIIAWNSSAPDPTAGRGILGRARTLDSAYDPLNAAYTLDKIGQVAVWNGALSGSNDGILGTSSRKVVAVSLASYDDGSCVALSDGRVACWGWNNNSVISSGSAGSFFSAPTPRAGLSNITKVVGYSGSVCGIDISLNRYCWGANGEGQLGIGNNMSPIATPTLSTALSTGAGITAPASIEMGEQATLAMVLDSGKTKVRCWGYTRYGCPADDGGSNQTAATIPVFYTPGATTANPAPNAVSELTNVSQISLKSKHACLVTAANEVWCGGNNDSGQLGIGNTSDPYSYGFFRINPASFAGTPVEVEAGFSHTCVRLSNNRVQCWGAGSYGEFGDGTTAAVRAAPGATVSNLTDAQRLLGGKYGPCALVSDGTVKCWGNRYSIASGNNADALVPTALVSWSGGPAVPDIQSKSTGPAIGYNNCLLSSSGVVRCFGWLGGGLTTSLPLGNGLTANVTSPSSPVGPWP